MSDVRPYKVLITEPWEGPVGDKVGDALKNAGCEIALGRPFSRASDEYSTAELKELVRDVDVLMVGSRELFSREVMLAAPRLLSIAKLGIGVERIDVRAATELGILVSNTPIPENYLGVAEFAVAMILGLAKNLKSADRAARQGLWRSTRSVFVKNKTVGIIGLGRVGSRVAQLLRPFEVRLLAYDPYVDPARAEQLNVALVELDTLLREADFVTLHAVVTEENREMLGTREFALMKPSAYLVNVARGALLDERALYQALKRGTIAGAALDVFEPEPPALSNPLLEEQIAPKTIFSPHAAGLTPELMQKMPLVQLDNCLKVIKAELPEYVVNPEVLPRWRSRLAERNHPR
jgi:D-3-phosphoglycerate dehydrogenase / 2-oxoglutarate reductase